MLNATVVSRIFIGCLHVSVHSQRTTRKSPSHIQFGLISSSFSCLTRGQAGACNLLRSALRSRRTQRRDANTKLTCMFFGAYSFNSTADDMFVRRGGRASGRPWRPQRASDLVPLILLPWTRQHDWLTLLTVSDHDLSRDAVIWITPL
jgi:hypothetical protein